MKEQDFKVGDLVKFSAKFAPYNGDQIGVVVEVSIAKPLHARYKVKWTQRESHEPIWYAYHHLRRIG
jgi:hypothetical protein